MPRVPVAVKEITMRRVLLVLIGLLAVLPAFAQAPVPPAPLHMPRGVATDVAAAQIDAVVKSMTTPVSDQQLRVVSIGGEYNIGVGVVRRAKPAAPNSIEHSQITEIYHVMSGSATMVTGGTMEAPRESAPESPVVTVLNGPSTSGGKIAGGTSRKVVAGDVIVIPPNTPHWFSEIESDAITYLVIRVDPHEVLPAGYVTRPQ